MHKVLIAGEWRDSVSSGSFSSTNPNTREALPDEYPVSTWEDCDAALDAATKAFVEIRQLGRGEVASFLDAMADEIEACADELVEMAFAETGLAKSPRLADVELPRTTNQLRLAAKSAASGSWSLPTIDTATGIRSIYAGLGPVVVFGPNNFPFAFGSVSGGDFAAAIAAGNPVIGKANSSHPGTTRIFAEAALAAAEKTGAPKEIVQLIYRTNHADGERLVSDPRVGATGYTGSRGAGLKLKTAADQAGKPIYLELSSVNPVFMLNEVIEDKWEALADEFVGSSLMGTGQFCTNPGVVFVPASESGKSFTDRVKQKFEEAPAGTLLSASAESSLAKSIEYLEKEGAEKLTTVDNSNDSTFSCPNTLLQVSIDDFIAKPEAMQTEAFGNAALFVSYSTEDQLLEAIGVLEGNLTGCIYSDPDGKDDATYSKIAPFLSQKVGRLLNDKMPTGVAVSPAMNHGGPFPATGSPGHSAVGIPGSIRRFAMLQCYDNVRHTRLPDLLKDPAPNPATWRFVDGEWSQESVQLTV